MNIDNLLEYLHLPRNVVVSTECVLFFWYFFYRQKDLEKLRVAVDAIHNWFQTNSVETVHKEQSAVTEKSETSSNSYEVFISYSHCNENKALQVLESLKIYNPDLNVFIDTAGLQTGRSWQQSLFHAIGN